MAKLSGGTWRTLQKEPVGTVTEGDFVSFKANVPSQNPAYPPQGVLKLNVDGDEVTIGCPKQLAGVFEEHEVEPGTTVLITYNGQKQGKKGGKPYHHFDVETVDSDEPGSDG